MPESFPADLLGACKVVPVVVLEDAALAVDLAGALLAGGVRAIELTFRTSAAAESIRRVREQVPDMVVGAGTMLSPEQVQQAVEAGAQFGVAPGHNPRVAAKTRELKLPFAPGVMTPTDVEAAIEAGFKTLKFFPAESAGSIAHLKSLVAPYKHLGITFIPTGGIDAAKAAEYLKIPQVRAVGGSWLTPKEVIDRRDWAGITKIARDSLTKLG